MDKTKKKSMEDKEDEYLSAMDNSRIVIRAIASELLNLSDAFSLTGNDQMSSELRHMGADLYKADKQIGDTVVQEINRQVKESHKNSTTVLEAALAGAKLAKKGKL